MLRKILFQAHWLAGITAGIVLAVVGVTGAMLSFEHQILDRLNADVRRVRPTAEQPLVPPELAKRIAARHPDKQITALSISGDPTRAARVTFAPERRRNQSGPPQGGRPRGETHYVNPYTGELIEGKGDRGAEFFRTIMTIHRWLTAGEWGNREIGKHIVGASTLLLVLMALSGLYLRWPGRHTWRTWLTLDFRLKGRSFLWNLHSVLGTWVLVACLLMALTGLQWSYEWYRNGLYAIAGQERPAGRGPGGGARDARSGPAELVDLSAAWSAFVNATGGAPFDTATFNLARGTSAPIEIRYLEASPRHERAFSTLAVDASTGEVIRHERYAEKSVGAKLVSSIFPLHSGSFFGLPGTVLFMVASLAMPLFTVTGWMLYLNRRARKARARTRDATTSAAPSSVPTAQSGSG
ncbi:MAG TPA: PepSY-associated TM helix domain-containing protein [Steroidobacteraceae bacterium]